jgi:cold shock CspA family protein
MSSNTNTNNNTNNTNVYIGQVKWFDNKKGYGFITLLDKNLIGKDVFVHHTAIVSKKVSQYRFLVEGEYVQVGVEKSTNAKYEYEAKQVSGILGGRIMCEIRQESYIKKHTVQSAQPKLDPTAIQL